MAEQTERANPYCKACGTRLSFSCGEIGPGCGAVIEPDWADLREMARNAGYRFSREGKGLRWDGSRWNILHQSETIIDGRRVFYLDRVGDYPGYVHVLLRSNHAEVQVSDPSPAEVLTAARLVGLIGGTS